MNKIFKDHVGDVVFSLLFFIKLSQASLGWAGGMFFPTWTYLS